MALLADDGRGLNNSRQQTILDLHVNRPPRPMAGPDRAVCPGEAVTLRRRRLERLGRRAGPLPLGLRRRRHGRRPAGRSTASRSPGCYEVRLAVTDDSGAQLRHGRPTSRRSTSTRRRSRSPASDRQGFVGGAYDQLLFDGAGSSDADGQPLSYLWDLGDGVTRTGEKVLHAYAEPGEYAVRLGVADGTGLACGQTWDEIKVDVRSRDQAADEAALGSATAGATRLMRLNLRTKLLLFAIAIAIVPLLVAGRTMIRIAAGRAQELGQRAAGRHRAAAGARRSTTCTSGPGSRRWS